MLALEPWLRAMRSSIDCALSFGDTRPLMVDGGTSSSDAPPAGDCSVLPPPPLSGDMESPDDAITRNERVKGGAGGERDAAGGCAKGSAW